MKARRRPPRLTPPRALATALLLAAPAALLIPHRAFGQSEEEIKQFRGALEVHMAGNLPKLVEYLRQIEPGSLNNPDAPGAPPWTAQAVWDTRTATTTTPDPNGGPPIVTIGTESYVSQTASEVREHWRRRAEAELQRIAAAAAAGTATEAAETLLEDGGLEEVDDERMSEYQVSLENCDEYASSDDGDTLEGCLE